MVGVGDEQLAVVVEEREADGRDTVRLDGAEEGVVGVVLECSGVEDEDGVVAARGDVEGAAVGGENLADGRAAGTVEAEGRVALAASAPAMCAVSVTAAPFKTGIEEPITPPPLWIVVTPEMKTAEAMSHNPRGLK